MNLLPLFQRVPTPTTRTTTTTTALFCTIVLLLGGYWQPSSTTTTLAFVLPVPSTTSATTRTTTTRLSVAIPLPDNADDYDSSTTTTATTTTTTTTTTELSASSLLPQTTTVVSPVSPGSAAFPKVGVLLLNLGGPETLDDVEGFLYNLFADPDIIRLPKPVRALQPLIAWFISKRRAPQSKAAYASIGGGSPILQYSQAQAALLLQQLAARHNITNAACYIGMRYWHPFTHEALQQIARDNVQALVIVPLYPQFSISTSGSSLRVLQEEFAKHSDSSAGPPPPPPMHTVVPSWYNRPGYINAVADLILHELEQITDDHVAQQKAESPHLAGKHVLFSAHGVPQSYIAAGDPYQVQMEQCVHAIGKVVQEKSKQPDQVALHLSYQSRVGPVEWLRPYTDDVLPELGQSGVRNLVVVPISFVSEHIETLEEIDMEYRELAEEHGVVNWRRAPALNTHAGFVADLADMVYEALQEPCMTVTEACIANSVGNLVMMDLQDSGKDGGGVYYNTAGVQNVVGAEEKTMAANAEKNGGGTGALVIGGTALAGLLAALANGWIQHGGAVLGQALWER